MSDGTSTWRWRDEDYDHKTQPVPLKRNSYHGQFRNALDCHCHGCGTVPMNDGGTVHDTAGLTRNTATGRVLRPQIHSHQVSFRNMQDGGKTAQWPVKMRDNTCDSRQHRVHDQWQIGLRMSVVSSGIAWCTRSLQQVNNFHGKCCNRRESTSRRAGPESHSWCYISNRGIYKIHRCPQS